MIRRFYWSLLFSILPILGLIPLNHYLVSNVHDFKEASDRNFITLELIESLIFFMLSFMIVSEYFRIHPDYKTVMWRHKQKNPDIPSKYYKDNSTKPTSSIADLKDNEDEDLEK